MDVEIARRRTVMSMLVDEACRTVTRRLTDAGQPFLVLKGATIATWLYADPAERTYGDLDLLVPPADEAAVVELLGDVGFEPLLRADTAHVLSPEEQPLRNRHGVDVDLHIALKGVRLAPEKAWEILSASTVPWNWAGCTVPALAPHARAMHLALHVAQGGLADAKAAADLRLGLARLEHPTWEAARDLAGELQALDAFTAGLAALPEGREPARRLGLAALSDVEYQMRAASVFKPAVKLERLLADQSWPQRLATARAHLFPSADGLRMLDPVGTTTRWGLARARVRHPFRVLARGVKATRERQRFRRTRPVD
ncbi:MAG: nucleotidyltransferase family protein [Actinomycetes bacterium]